ncbi:MerR family transcriptional regulator [Staphylococcus devriesei]|uniref:MerR family transcriptional regulator n=1 Tax=Staphylococcus devriesei TaxID=586733 RepID=UPI000D1C35F3|nr:MerR family transcriptional regulator [Staphylococcus devriesei]PTF19433.1 MerR family transcriptional regulator [Staphylococcus devriesei]
MLNNEYFTPKEVHQITNISTRTLHYYHEIELLVPSYIAESGYRYYSTQDIAKLQVIIFLRQLNLSLHDIQQYFDKSIREKNQILENNYMQIIQHRNQLNQMITFLDYHLTHNREEEINMEKFNDFNVQDQYDREAELKYGDTEYYQAFKTQRKNLSDSDKQKSDSNVNQQLNQFFEKMNVLLEEGYNANEIQVYRYISELKSILQRQVLNVDGQFLEYMALTYENDERFAQNINKSRNSRLNQYIAQAIRAYNQ